MGSGVWTYHYSWIRLLSTLQGMTQEETMTTQKNRDIPHPDPHIIPAETAARAKREGSHFGQVDHDSPTDTEHIHTRDGYTVDQEGLINNYAVEPPMYVNEPGDLTETEAAIAKSDKAN